MIATRKLLILWVFLFTCPTVFASKSALYVFCESEKIEIEKLLQESGNGKKIELKLTADVSSNIIRMGKAEERWFKEEYEHRVAYLDSLANIYNELLAVQVVTIPTRAQSKPGHSLAKDQITNIPSEDSMFTVNDQLISQEYRITRVMDQISHDQLKLFKGLYCSLYRLALQRELMSILSLLDQTLAYCATKWPFNDSGNSWGASKSKDKDDTNEKSPKKPQKPKRKRITKADLMREIQVLQEQLNSANPKDSIPNGN